MPTDPVLHSAKVRPDGTPAATAPTKQDGTPNVYDPDLLAKLELIRLLLATPGLPTGAATEATLAKTPTPEDVTRQIQRVLPAPFVGSDYGPALVYSSKGAVSTTALIRGGPANVLAFTYEHTEAAAVYIQIHDKATGVVVNDVPVFCWLVEPSLVTAGMRGGLDKGREFFGDGGYPCLLGLSFAISSDPTKYTAIAGTATKHTFNLVGM